jgi:Bacterial Ig-like domain
MNILESASERLGMNTVRNVILASMVLMPSLTLVYCNKGNDDVDLNPPEIVSRTPANEAGGVALNSEITITFNKPVSGVSHSSISLVEVNSYGAVDSDVTYDAATNTATLKPKNNLRYDFLYVVTVNSQVRSAAGVSFRSESWVFTTGYEDDSKKPTVTSTTPEPDDYSISTGSTIIAKFSEPVKNVCDVATGASTTFILRNKNTSVLIPASVVYDSDERKATLTPTVPLDDWTEYEVELTSGITDMAGNTLESSVNTSFYFMTDDTHVPVILNASPAGGDLNVARNTQIIVTFSERVQSSLVKASSFYVKDVPTDTTVSAIVSYDEANNRAILMPSASLTASTQYRVYLTNLISDYAGKNLSNTDWTFTTGAALADSIAPTVIARVPSPNALNVDPEAALKATFSENVVGAETNFTLIKTSDSSIVAATVVYSGITREATLTPKYPLEQGTLYTVQLSSNIKDSSNNALIAETWTFTTADNTKPTVTGKTPGVGELTSANTVEAVFSERLDPSSVLSTTVTVYRIDGVTDPQISGSVQYFDATRTVRFVPDGGFAFDTTYRVMLTNGLKDLSGNTLNPVQWEFKTRVEPDTTNPDVINRSPSENAEGVSISPVILFSFTESVVSTQIGANNVKLLLGGVTPVNATVSYNSADKQVTIRPDAKLAYNAQYTVQVSGNIPGYEIKDLSGNSLVNRSWIFTTEADTTPPHVSFKIPDNGTKDIFGNAIVVEAVFSEPVTGVDILTPSFYLENEDDPTYNPVPLLMVEKVTGPDERYRLKLISTANPITESGSYKVILDTSKIKDTAGNFLAAYGNWY